MNRYLFITWSIAAILAVATITYGASQNDAQKQERAVALWEEAIRAKGGHERLQSVQNLLISSEIYTQAGTSATNTETERLYVMPDKAWIYTYSPDLRMSLDATVINFQYRFCMLTLSPPFSLSPCIPDKPLEYLLEDPVIYLMETKWVRPQPLAARVEGKGNKQIDVIETKVGSLRVGFYLDRETRLPTRLVTDWSGVRQALTKGGLMTVKLEDYEAVDGIMMPRRVIREQQGKTPENEVSSRATERARYLFNVAYNPKLFNSTVSPKVKRKDWMP